MYHARTSSMFAIAVFALAVAASAQPASSDAELAQALRAGGHVIVFRHGATHSDQADNRLLFAPSWRTVVREAAEDVRDLDHG
jgi:hypothetical protein